MVLLASAISTIVLAMLLNNTRSVLCAEKQKAAAFSSRYRVDFISRSPFRIAQWFLHIIMLFLEASNASWRLWRHFPFQVEFLRPTRDLSIL